MADKTINQLTEDATPASSDFIPSWDTSGGATKKVAFSNIPDALPDGSITPNLRGGGFAAGNLDVASTGAKAVTGLSFQPKFLKFHGAASGSDVSSIISVGSWDGTTMRCSTAAYNAAQEGASRYYTDRIAIITVASGAASTFVRVGTFAFTADGFTYEVTTASALAGMSFEAYG